MALFLPPHPAQELPRHALPQGVEGLPLLLEDVQANGDVLGQRVRPEPHQTDLS